MRRTQLSGTTAVVLALGLLGMGTSFAQGTGANATGTVPVKTSAKLTELLKERVKAAETEFEARRAEFRAGKGTLDAMCDVTVRLGKARHELVETKEQRLKNLENQVKLFKETEEVIKLQFNAGRVPITFVAMSEYYRLNAEIELERERLK